MSDAADKSKDAQSNDETSSEAPKVRCLSRRVWDWGRKWGDTLIHLVWFWRAAVLILVIVAGVFAWHEPDVQQRIAATGMVLALGIVLALDLFVAFLNLPLLMFYIVLWVVLTLASLLDIIFYTRHLLASQNRVAILVLLANVAVAAGGLWLWSFYLTLGNPDQPVQPADPPDFTSLLG